jgi:hypothetical protein
MIVINRMYLYSRVAFLELAQSSLNCFGSMPMVPDFQSQPNLHIFGKTYNIQYVVPFI